MQSLPCDCRNTTILSVTVTWQLFQLSISLLAVIFLIVPKARRSSYTMAFKIKVITEAEAIENNSEIAHGKQRIWLLVWNILLTILKHVMLRVLQSQNLWSIGINIIVLVFESQTLSYKPNPISYEKSPKLLCLILKKLLGL